MSYKAFRGLRILVIIFILLTVSIAITLENAILASFAMVIGIIAMLAIKRNVKEIKTDEMIQNIAQKSAWWAYNIFVPFLAVLSIFLTVDNKEGSDLYNLGVTLSYVALIHIALYLIAFLYFKKKYISDEKQN
ncbi:MAG: DUF2178 domain-containing protein [Parcubacteria group bacterium]|jgi:uncharacterized membrane protein|nr:DUF2178 domain-containing protein [Parcubacteria group bacterium]